MYLIVGLGNPEPEYSKTRHNMGFDVINKLSKKFKANVVVSVGIHVDNASKSDIEKLVSNTNEAIHDLENKITNEVE